MSSSNPCKSHSGSVHDSHSESSIEYVQTTQSPISPNIQLTTPIASSVNVSGLNIDVGKATSQTSSTWSIPNISVTPIPPIPTNTQIHVSEGPGSTPEISSKANPQDFLLNPGQNTVVSQEPFGKSKQPTLNIASGSQVHLGYEKLVDGGQQKRPVENVSQGGISEGNTGLTLHKNMAPKGKTVRSQEPIEDPETGHASSSREKIVDDEDENMSPTQSETNYDPRRDNFMAHEQSTQLNSEFTHPQMPLAQSMLHQPEMRQQRNQAPKAHNVAKRESQKEEKNC
ncbi:hypothetical protein O181_054332 [Austropuccinia psidii MF-1]|uniref:Uncharacterized protein n=1 Tax=Austropuccinia psidii MF-1 TaxID=1389203 RepID=A0A9Q3HSF2_9BASI|nr:hypothetical protein [Austropuccinia psidii MF-1]